MTETLNTIALLVPNPALRSILTSTLAEVRQLRVRAFETPAALCAYLRITPADVVVMDLDGGVADPFALVARLRHQTGAPTHLKILGLAGQATSTGAGAVPPFGLDEMIFKPMSPLYLVERVIAQLGARGKALRRPEFGALRRPRQLDIDWSEYGDNIVPLFRNGRAPELRPF